MLPAGKRSGGLHQSLLTPLQKLYQAAVSSFLRIFEEVHFETFKNAFKRVLWSFMSA